MKKPLYSIARWDELYEVRDSKRIDGPLSWVALPTKQDGLGFRLLASHENRANLFSAFILMLEIAAKQPKKDRGRILRDGFPLDAQDLSAMTGWPKQAFEDAFKFFTDNRIGWIACDSKNGSSKGHKRASDGPSSVHQASLQDRTGQDKTGQNSDAGASAAAKPPATPDEDWIKTLEAAPAYAGVNVRVEISKCQVWFAEKQITPSRKRILNWLNRADKTPTAISATPTNGVRPQVFRSLFEIDGVIRACENELTDLRHTRRMGPPEKHKPPGETELKIVARLKELEKQRLQFLT